MLADMTIAGISPAKENGDERNTNGLKPAVSLQPSDSNLEK